MLWNCIHSGFCLVDFVVGMGTLPTYRFSLFIRFRFMDFNYHAVLELKFHQFQKRVLFNNIKQHIPRKWTARISNSECTIFKKAQKGNIFWVLIRIFETYECHHLCFRTLQHRKNTCAALLHIKRHTSEVSDWYKRVNHLPN